MKSELPALIYNGEALEVFSVLGAGGSKTVLDVSVDGLKRAVAVPNETDSQQVRDAKWQRALKEPEYAALLRDNGLLVNPTYEVHEMSVNGNVTDVLAAVSEGSNEVGVVYATDAAFVADKVEIIAEAPADSLQTPVLYPVGLIEDKEASEDDTKAAEAFLDYVESDAAIKVFEDYGFTAFKAEASREDAEASEDSTETEDSTDSTGSTSK